MSPGRFSHSSSAPFLYGSALLRQSVESRPVSLICHQHCPLESALAAPETPLRQNLQAFPPKLKENGSTHMTYTQALHEHGYWSHPSLCKRFLYKDTEQSCSGAAVPRIDEGLRQPHYCRVQGRVLSDSKAQLH
jgi:hypothetical protein